MPLEIIELILKQTSWMIWVCVFIEALRPRSLKPLKEYLRHGIHGFSNFVKVSSTSVYYELSSVCSGWRNLLKNERYGKSIKLDLLSNISRTAIKRSEKILIDSLHIQDGLLDLCLHEKLITTNEKFYCESMPGISNEMFLCFLCREKSQSFTKLLKFLILLKKQYKSHLVNYVISFGVHWPNFGNKWPLDKRMKFLVHASQDDIIHSMNPDKNVGDVTNKLDQKDERERVAEASCNLVSLLFENNCITVVQRDELDKLEYSDKNQKLVKLLENGSGEMFQIVVDYLGRTGQNYIVNLLQPNREVNKYSKYIVNCLIGAAEILISMIERKEVAPSLLDHFSIKDKTVFSDRLNRYQNNEILLNILECSKADVYIYFLNFLLTTKQPLLPMFQSVSHSKLMERFESYLLDTIYADTELLLKLADFNVITHTQMRAIETKRTPMMRNKELLFVVSNASPKSFNLFLTALVQSNQSNILENMILLHSEPKDTEAQSAMKQVDMVVDIFQETQ